MDKNEFLDAEKIFLAIQAQSVLDAIRFDMKGIGDNKLSKQHYLWQATIHAAEHPYGCTCKVCAVFFASTCGPMEYEDGEFGPFGKDMLDEIKKILGEAPVKQFPCNKCGGLTWDYDDNIEHYCESCWQPEEE